jgi:hypothetical protein
VSEKELERRTQKIKCKAIKKIDAGDEIVKMEVGIKYGFDDSFECIEYFKEKYGHLLQSVFLQVLLIGPNNKNPDQTLYNKTHVPILILEDLLSSAKYPRLSIQNAMTIQIAMLGESYQKSMYESMSLYEKHCDPKLFVVNVGPRCLHVA